MTTLQLTENARTVLKTRYLLPGETPEDLFRRVARAVAEAERPEDRDRWEASFYEMMADLRFMPNSPTLFNAGTGQGTLSACFVIPIEDTMESIMAAATTSAMIQKYGGGIGYSFAKLRSRGSGISTTHGKACGAVAVLKMLSALSDMITQGGKRHGANMGILHVRHPEILDFIHMKDDDQTAQNFNISVAVTDEFMEAVANDAPWELVDPHSGQRFTTDREGQPLMARRIWNDIVQSAWRTGDPGLYFIDEANRHNPTPHLGQLESTNPCGEVPLLPNEACNLGSINLARFVVRDGGRPRMDMDALRETAAVAARFLDDVVTINKFPTPEVAQAVAATRKTGLGVMGWHDALVQLGIPYDSQEALDLAEHVMGAINETAREVSIQLARERGPYPACVGEPIRNATRTCIAPTGSISAIAGCSSGIEPIFALAFVKNVLDGKRLREVNPYFEQVARERGFYSEELMEEVARTGSCQHIDAVPEDVKRLFKTAMEIDYETHVRTQAAFQKHTDLAVSKTINMRNDVTVKDVEHAYWMAWELKCKGITIYRDGSKSRQVLEVEGAKHEPATAESTHQAELVGLHAEPRERPSVVVGRTERVRTGHGNTYVTINFDEQGQPFEVFTTLGKAGGCDSAQLEAISRLISLALRSGIPAEHIVEQLRGITCCPAWDNGTLVRSAPDAVALALDRAIKAAHEGHQSYATQLHMLSNPVGSTSQALKQAEGVAPTLAASSIQAQRESARTTSAGGYAGSSRCPDCGGSLVYQEGCLNCLSCGYTKCS